MKKKVLLFMLLLCAYSLCACGTKDYTSDAKEDLEDLQRDYDNLQSTYNTLKSDYSDLETDYEQLETSYNSLVEEYNELLELYNAEVEIEIESPEDLSDYATDITYDDLARKPDDYEGKAICLKGEVVQLLEGEDENDLRVAVNGDYDQMVYFVYDPDIIDTRVLEEDTITMYGNYYGIYSYEATSGTTISIPLIIGTYVEIN